MAFPELFQVEDGVLRTGDGGEVRLWGNNFQPNLHWEYKFRLEPLGVPADPKELRAMCDDGFRDLKRWGCDLIRCHLCPADFSDAEGNLAHNLWLDMLGYLLFRAREEGVYVSLAFVNSMEWNAVEDCFLTRAKGREDWIFDPDMVEHTHAYVRNLVNHVNPHTGLALKDDAVICAWEPINEPEYLTWAQCNADPDHRARFLEWTRLTGSPDNDWYFERYQYQVVRDYIDGLHDLLREEGAARPLIWNCNWPRMIVGRESIFQAVADSRVEAVSFCLYPGQDEVDAPFMSHPKDTSGLNFLPFLHRCFDDYFHLGWLRDSRFADKAKVVYEFETMYNAESAYLHPAMAKLFRSLGVQMATMWTHCFNRYAPYMGCAHNMNPYTTPRKAAGFRIAGELFRALPREFAFSLDSDSADAFDGFAFSFVENTARAVVGDRFLHAGEVTGGPLPDDPAEVAGFGSCPFVDYAGSGQYRLRRIGGEWELELYPHARPVREKWKYILDGDLVTELDTETAVPFRLRLPGVPEATLRLKPGRYRLRLDGEVWIYEPLETE